MLGRRPVGMLAGWILASFLCGCKDPQAATTAEADDGQQGDGDTADTSIVTVPLKVDLLLVLEGRSTCRWLGQFASGLQPFVATVQKTLAADMRVAVITMDVMGDASTGARGRFNRWFATEYPSWCDRRVDAKCQSDSECQDDPLHLGARWLCEPPPGGAGNLLNLDGSVNSSCHFACDTDQQCRDAFATEDATAADAARWTCVMRGAEPSHYRCVQEPATADCPADLPAVARYPSTLDAAQVTALVEPPADGASEAWVSEVSMRAGSCADYVYNCRDCEGAADVAACRNEKRCDRYETKACAAIAADDASGRALCAQQCAFANFERNVRCMANVEISTRESGLLKAGLQAAWLALDPQGENAQQLCLPQPDPQSESDPARKAAAEALLAECFLCKDMDGFGVAAGDCPSGYRDDCDATNPACRRFLREDAYMLVVLLTDEDDCSIADGKRIVVEDYPVCKFLGDSGQDPESLPNDIRLKSVGWNSGVDYRVPLAPISTYSERFNRLIPGHEERLLMAVVAGDAAVCFDHEAEAAQNFAARFSTQYWCNAYRPQAWAACQAEYDCYQENHDQWEAAEICIADHGESAMLDCYRQATTPAAQPAVDSCIAGYRVDPEVERLFAEQPDVAENLRRQVCQPGQPLSTELQREVYRKRFRYSAIEPGSPISINSAVCQSDWGRAEHAPRLQQFVHNLGPNGFFHNICGAEGLDIRLGPLAQDLAARLGSLAADPARR